MPGSDFRRAFADILLHRHIRATRGGYFTTAGSLFQGCQLVTGPMALQTGYRYHAGVGQFYFGRVGNGLELLIIYLLLKWRVRNAHIHFW